MFLELLLRESFVIAFHTFGGEENSRQRVFQIMSYYSQYFILLAVGFLEGGIQRQEFGNNTFTLLATGTFDGNFALIVELFGKFFG